MKDYYLNKVIVITGASYGIGYEMAKRLSFSNCSLVVAARTEDKLNELAKVIRDNGSKALVVKCDVTNQIDCENLIKVTIQKYNKLDLLINNVGVTSRSFIQKTETKVLKHLMDINFWGAVEITKHAIPHLLQSKGMVVAISSVIGKVPVPGRCGYAAAKHALEAYFETLRMEMEDQNMDVIVIRPSYTNTLTRIKAVTGNGTPQDYSTLDEKKLMTAENAAFKILNAIENKKHGYTLGKKMEGSWLITLYQLFPNFISKLIVKKIKQEPHSLFEY